MSENIRQRLKAVRGTLTQPEFAAKLGFVGENANRLVSGIERGRARAQDEYLKKVADVFGQSYDELLRLRDDSDTQMGEQTVPYRVAPRLDLSLIFKTQSLEALVRTLSGVLLDAGARPEMRLQNAEVVFAEIHQRLIAAANSTGASAAADNLVGDAEREVDPVPESQHSPGAGAPTGPASPPPRGVLPASKERPGAPKPAPK